MPQPRKSISHGKIGEAAVYAKCWMHGIPAFHTGGLRSNFEGSDLIVETDDPRKKQWIQVKTGSPILKGHVYLTQCAGDKDLDNDKFCSDFVVFVNLDSRIAKSHSHDGSLDFSHMSFFIVPVKDANRMYKRAVRHWHAKPKRDGGHRKLGNTAVHVDASKMEIFQDAWHLIRSVSGMRG